MKTILLVISPSRQSSEAFQWSVDRAKKEDCLLRLAYVIDQDLHRAVQRALVNDGLIGDKPGNELIAALNKEYEGRGIKVLAGLAKRCREAGVACETVVEKGPYIEVCQSLANKPDVVLLVMTGRKVNFFKRIFSVSESAQLLGRVPCDVKIY